MLSEELTRIVLDTALTEWQSHVEEPPGQNWDRIDEYIRGPQGLGWSWLMEPYTWNRQFAWCGAFIAFCYGAAGLLSQVRKSHLGSTRRLWGWANGTLRYVPYCMLLPGDIVVLGSVHSKRFGSHIALFDGRKTNDGIWTFEGNAHGEGPGKLYYEGVVVKERPFAPYDPEKYRIMYGVRPLERDFAKCSKNKSESASKRQCQIAL